MHKKIRIAVDAMGGDHGPAVVIAGALKAAKKGVALSLVGDKEKIEAVLSQHKIAKLDIEVVHASEEITMHDKPADALRRKKDSSIQVAYKLVKDGHCHGFISAGNSGAVVACGMFTLGRIQGVERVALASFMPTAGTPTILLDVGANVDSKPYQLAQFAFMGDVLAQTLFDIKKPRVAVLSIGEEEGKGNSVSKETCEILKKTSLNFIGNVEGRDVLADLADVIVCDGFVGNVSLKLAEGVVKSLKDFAKIELKKSIIARIGVFLAYGMIKRVVKRLDYTEYGGAPVLGLKKIAIVCHGSSNEKAIKNAILLAARYEEKNTTAHLVARLEANNELAQYGKSSTIQD